MKWKVPRTMKAVEALKILFPDSSRRTLQHWIKGRRFAINGTPIDKEDTVLEQDTEITVGGSYTPKKTFEGTTVLYEDRYLIAVNKPPGMLSVPLDTKGEKKDLLGNLRKNSNTSQIFAVHRIDREVSGVIIFARGMQSRYHFKELFEAHDLQREYTAIVEGQLTQPRGTWKCQLEELPDYRVVVVPAGGRTAITHFEVLRRSPKYSYLRLMLETGRKHQIRVHCQEAGHPILGDQRYGSIEDPIDRVCLHARRIAFVHPFTKKPLTITAPLPHAFKKLGATETLLHLEASL